MISVTRIFFFEAAHHLPDHEAKCKNLHGHSYKIEVTIAGAIKPKGPESGMVIDFGLLKKAVQKRITSRLDHSLLNDTLPASFLPPTAEHLALFIALEMKAEGLNVTHIRVWETENSHADWRNQ